MAESSDTICITCGQALGETPKLHRLSDGTPCPACRDRLLETLPPLLPREVPVERGEVEPDHGELDRPDGWMLREGTD